MSQRSSRRDFLKTSAMAGVGFWVAGGLEAAQQRQPGPNDRLNIALIGAGGRGEAHIGPSLKTENLIALCDVDDARAANAYKRAPTRAVTTTSACCSKRKRPSMR